MLEFVRVRAPEGPLVVTSCGDTLLPSPSTNVMFTRYRFLYNAVRVVSPPTFTVRLVEVELTPPPQLINSLWLVGVSMEVASNTKVWLDPIGHSKLVGVVQGKPSTLIRTGPTASL